MTTPKSDGHESECPCQVCSDVRALTPEGYELPAPVMTLLASLDYLAEQLQEGEYSLTLLRSGAVFLESQGWSVSVSLASDGTVVANYCQFSPGLSRKPAFRAGSSEPLA